MPIDVNEDVLGLQVAIKYVLIVDVLEAQQDLAEVELGLSLREQSFILQEVEKLAARAEIDHEM